MALKQTKNKQTKSANDRTELRENATVREDSEHCFVHNNITCPSCLAFRMQEQGKWILLGWDPLYGSISPLFFLPQEILLLLIWTQTVWGRLKTITMTASTAAQAYYFQRGNRTRETQRNHATCRGFNLTRWIVTVGTRLPTGCIAPSYDADPVLATLGICINSRDDQDHIVNPSIAVIEYTLA